jgi:hypothetical protein
MRITLASFKDKFVKVPDEASRRLVRLAPHPEQQRFIQAVDEREHGLRRYREFVVSWCKKAGKSTTAAVFALWALIADDLAQDREVIVVANDLAQSRDVVFSAVCKIAQRDPWLRKHTRIMSTEVVFTEPVTDPRTGGTYEQSHVLRAVPRDVRGLHGVNPSALILDEFWAQDDYELIEALAPSPARRSPMTLYASYAGLRSQRHPGNPFYDLVQRAEAGTDPSLFYSRIGGPDGYKVVPWITQRWVDGMRRIFATVPSKFNRLVLNEWSTGESSFISDEELQDAIDTNLREPAQAEPGVRYAMGVDLGLTFDWTAVVVVHVDPNGGVIVDAIRTWRGTRRTPVSLEAVEAEIVRLAERFPMAAVLLDQWQAAFLGERLRGRGVPGVDVMALESTRIDRLVTMLKGLFAQRAIKIPGEQKDLIEQIEAVDIIETGKRNRRRDLVKLEPSGRTGAAAHDDLVIALALAAEAVESSIGRRTMPQLDSCEWENYHGRYRPCFLFDAPGLIPSGDATCAHCPGWLAVKSRYAAYIERGGLPMDWRSFHQQYFRPSWRSVVRDLEASIGLG